MLYNKHILSWYLEKEKAETLGLFSKWLLLRLCVWPFTRDD